MSNNNDQRIGQEIMRTDAPKFATIYADPPWRYGSRRGKGAPEHGECYRYSTLTLDRIKEMPVAEMAKANAHIYLWVVNAHLDWGCDVMRAWGFAPKTNLVWAKTKRDGGLLLGMGNFFRHSHEICIFGVRGSLATRSFARRQHSVVRSVRREHSRKPDEFYRLIEKCSPGPRLELFARHPRAGWWQWGNQLRDQLFTQRIVETSDESDLPTTLVYTDKRKHVVHR